MSEHYLFALHFMEKNIFILDILCMYALVFQRNKTHACVSLKHVQHFDAHISNQEKEKEKKKEKNIQLATFRDTCDITKHFKN